MHRTTPLNLLACAALLLAAGGCTFDDIAPPAALLPASDTFEPPAAGHELHRMFEAEKAAAPIGELPAQF